MTRYIIKRLLIAVPTLIGITIIDYAIMCFAGSPLEMLQGARISRKPLRPGRRPWDWISLFISSILYGWASFSGEIWGYP